MSRLFDVTGRYWLWMAAIFALYVMWDISAEKLLDEQQTFRWSLCGDGAAAAVFSVCSMALDRGWVAPSLSVDAAAAAVYGCAVWCWHGCRTDWIRAAFRRPRPRHRPPDGRGAAPHPHGRQAEP